MMRILSMLASATLLLTAGARSDTWEQTYGTELPEQAFFSLGLDDGGTLTCGVSIIDVSYSIVSSESAGGLDCMLVRTGPDKEILWQGEYFSGPWPDLGVAGVQTEDGCFVIAGVTTSMEEGQRNWLFKLNDSGEVLWERFPGTDGDDWTYDMIRSSDGGFVLVGYTDPLDGTGTVISALKTDAEGREVWNRQYVDAGTGMGEALLETENGDFLIIGSVEDTETGKHTAPFVMRVDPEGNELWLQVYADRSDNCYPLDVARLPGGDIIMTGYAETASWDYDVWAARVTPDGEMIDQWTYGGMMDDMAFGISSSPEGCVIAGSTASEGAGRIDLWVFCIDPSGEVIWSETHGGPGNEGAEHITSVPGGGYLLSGYTSSWGAGDTDIWVLMVDEEGRMD